MMYLYESCFFSNEGHQNQQQAAARQIRDPQSRTQKRPTSVYTRLGYYMRTTTALLRLPWIIKVLAAFLMHRATKHKALSSSEQFSNPGRRTSCVRGSSSLFSRKKGPPIASVQSDVQVIWVLNLHRYCFAVWCRHASFFKCSGNLSVQRGCRMDMWSILDSWVHDTLHYTWTSHTFLLAAWPHRCRQAAWNNSELQFS